MPSTTRKARKTTASGGVVVQKRKYESDKAAAGRLAQALTGLSDNWIACRDMMHAWEVQEDFHVVPPANSVRNQLEIARVLVCARCETQRKEVFIQERFGLSKIAQSYAYPENYQIPGVPRGVKPKAIVQAEQYRRAMEKIATTQRKRSA